MSGSSIEKFIGWENLETLNLFMFHVCYHLRIIDLSMTKIREIPDKCFQHCYSLRKILFPAGVTKIMTISNLFNLESISIPAAVNNLSENVFTNITKLKIVAYFGNTSFERINLFSGCPSNIIVRVTKLYPSNLFSNILVTYDAYELGSQIPTTCHTIRNSYYYFHFNILHGMILISLE